MALFSRKLIVLFCAAFALQSCAAEPERGPVILAPASMQEVMEAIADAWEAQGNARPILSIAGTPAIARQAAEGAPADIVITADDEWMDWLEAREILLEDTRAPLVSNGLALVRGAETDPSVTLMSPLSSLATGDPDTVPAGRYARAILAERMEWQGFVIPTDSVRAALALVERGEADFAFVYTSDLLHHGAGLTVEESWSDIGGLRIRYPMAMLRSSEHAKGADLYRFLRSEEALQILQDQAFLPPDGSS